MLDYNDLYTHFCLLIHSQDTWKEKKKNQLFSDVKKEFLYFTGHSDCNICNTCPVCLSLNDLFDPEHPGPYYETCKACDVVYRDFKSKLGKSDGLILFSHTVIPDEAVKAMVEKLLEEEAVKKVYILEITRPSRRERKKYRNSKLSDMKVTKTAFLQACNEDKIIPLTVYEIRKDSYY